MISASTAARVRSASGQVQWSSQSGLKLPILRSAEPTFQAAAGALLLLPVEHRRQPGLGCDFGPVCQQTVQVQRLGAGAQSVAFESSADEASEEASLRSFS